MKAHIKHVLDYMKCPMLYRFRYVDDINPLLEQKGTQYKRFNENSMEELFDQEIHKLMYHIFNYVQDGRYPSVYILRQKWSQLWMKNKKKDDILFESNAKNSTPINRILEKRGIKVIENVHPAFKENPGVPLLVGQNTTVKIGKHELEVTLDLVREVALETGERGFEIVDFKTGIETMPGNRHVPINLHVHNDLNMTAASLAFEQLTGATENQITYYDLVNNKEHRTRRTDADKRSLEHILDQVEYAIRNNIYYPVMNHQCRSCPFQKICYQRDWYENE